MDEILLREKVQLYFFVSTLDPENRECLMQSTKKIFKQI